MGRISQHLTGRDYKKTHQRKLDEQRALYLERRERQIQELEQEIVIKELSAPYKYDWRSDLLEGMTSSSLLQTALGGQGDTILDTTTWTNHNPSVSRGVGGFGSPTITLSGDPSPYVGNSAIAGFPISVQKYDRLIIDVTTNGTRLRMYGSSANGFPKFVDTTSSGTYTIDISNESNTSTWTVVTVGSGTVSISNPRFQRRTPLNVILGLDDPEATNFIRTDPIMRGLSADERRKKLEDMLDSGDEYILKQLGLQGSQARPADTGNVRSWEQAADNEIAQLSPSDYNQERQIDQMLLKGLQRGDYGTGPAIDKQIQNILKNMQQRTPGGLPRAQANSDMQIASYEPQGQVLSEKKLKSPKEVMNKIPGYYDGKPAPLGFPDSPPPEMVNGFHPDLVDGKKVADRFNRLDPQSAQAMPPTGNPHIDKKVRAAAKKPK